MIITEKKLDEIRTMILLGYSPEVIIKRLAKEIITTYVFHFIVFGKEQANILIGKTKLLTYDNNR